MAQLDKLNISGFKSICRLEDFPLKSINLVIGGNGAGKSNFIEIFKFLRALMQLPLPGFNKTDLQKYVADAGSAGDLLFNGRAVTEQIEIKLLFGQNGYQIVLRPTQDDTLRIDSEHTYYSFTDKWYSLRSRDGFTPGLLEDKDEPGVLSRNNISHYVYESISSWQMYHFHDTGRLSPIKAFQDVDDNAYLRFDGSNLASYLYKLKGTLSLRQSYADIVKTIQQVAPFFDDFVLIPRENDKIRLLWKQKGSDYPLKPQALSDGTLRFICLATVLLQPHHPEMILIDEPELGLHPYAISILAELVKSRAIDTQLVLATQSSEFIDCFDPEDVVVCDRKDGQSTFTRLEASELDAWLENYTLGELWRKNVLSGGPMHE
jgi:predicted ATPase